ncbi:zinc-ribbon domain-containing protein [Agromyces sp. Leaf222]|uniref:zinc-ribbon domain-containing protein n=1 Tax=Agromyces sp. Leaf222 TaxID=1735688 RepID=UPI000B0E178A|nr:zinc-ribbon domain-containing protein [Agromyces sp. Leaf222]
MLPDLGRPFPVRVRPHRGETSDSYTVRLCAANHVGTLEWGYLIGQLSRQLGDSDHSSVSELLAERKGSLRQGHFAAERAAMPHHADGSRCAQCDTGNRTRYACQLCVEGALIPVYPHRRGHVCTRHRIWTGPDADLVAQVTVGDNVLEADRAYRKLIRRGHLDAHRLAELEGCIDAWRRAEDEVLGAPERFAYAIRVAARIVEYGRCLGAQPTHAADLYGLLDGLLDAAVGAEHAVLTDRVWLLLETTDASDAEPRGASGLHTFLPSRRQALAEPGERTDALRTSSYPRGLHLHHTQFHSSTRAETRDQIAARSDIEVEYRCARGHDFVSTPAILRAAGTGGADGCPYCSNRLPLSGFNTLDDRYPNLAAQWHPTRNGNLHPDQVLPGSGIKRWWLCPDGHTYDATPNTRTTSGTGCGYCANQRVDPAINSLAHTHRHLVLQWDASKNGDLTPQDVVAGSERQVWWRCAHGHSYRTAVTNRAAGRGCHYCTGQHVDPERTSLAAKRPDIAAIWHPTKNGTLTPADVMPGSQKKVWWRCDNGHDYDGAIASRVKGVGCRYCSNRARSTTNTMAVARPDLAAQWHPTKNNTLTPADVVPGTSKRIWWICQHQHEWQVSGDNRVRQQTGCPYCSNKRVWPGFNDLATTHPHLAVEWHPTRNGDVTPDAIVAGTAKNVWWLCPTGHEYRASGDRRVSKSAGCRECQRNRREAQTPAE